MIARLAPRHGVEEVRVTDEDEYFPPPRNLRDLLAADRRRRHLPARRPGDDRPPLNDRTLHASDVLAQPGLTARRPVRAGR